MNSNKKISEVIRLTSILINFIVAIIISTTLISAFVYVLSPVLKSKKSEEKPTSEAVIDKNKIENGIHVKTGLKDAEGLMTVVNNCTNCHSSKLLLQNRMDSVGWNNTITWMQETQGLWELGENKQVIIDYLTKNYPIEKKGRRENLTNIEWYELSK